VKISEVQAGVEYMYSTSKSRAGEPIFAEAVGVYPCEHPDVPFSTDGYLFAGNKPTFNELVERKLTEVDSSHRQWARDLVMTRENGSNARYVLARLESGRMHLLLARYCVRTKAEHDAEVSERMRRENEKKVEDALKIDLELEIARNLEWFGVEHSHAMMDEGRPVAPRDIRFSSLKDLQALAEILRSAINGG